MPNENYEPSKTQFGEMLQEKMFEKGLGIRELSIKIGATYEYVRKMARGISLPSKYMAKAMAPILSWPEEDMMQVADTDRVKLRFGSIPLELAGKNPELDPFERGWPKLTKQQKNLLLEQLKTYLTQNKKHKARGEKA